MLLQFGLVFWANPNVGDRDGLKEREVFPGSELSSVDLDLDLMGQADNEVSGWGREKQIGMEWSHRN